MVLGGKDALDRSCRDEPTTASDLRHQVEIPGVGRPHDLTRVNHAARSAAPSRAVCASTIRNFLAVNAMATAAEAASGERVRVLNEGEHNARAGKKPP